jgi:hypothetical protein
VELGSRYKRWRAGRSAIANQSYHTRMRITTQTR